MQDPICVGVAAVGAKPTSLCACGPIGLKYGVNPYGDGTDAAGHPQGAVRY